MRKYGIHYVQVRHFLCAGTAFSICNIGNFRCGVSALFYALHRHSVDVTQAFLIDPSLISLCVKRRRIGAISSSA